MRFWALVVDSLREIYARKVILGIVIIEVIALSITSLILFSEGMQHEYADARASKAGTVSSMDENSAENNELDNDELTNDDSLLSEFGEAPVDSSMRADTARSHSLESVKPDRADIGQEQGTLVIDEMVRGEMGAFAIPTILATLFLGIFATAGIVPSMMEKGTIDLLLSKPLARWKLLWGRAAGGAIAVGTNLLLFTTAVFVLYGLA
ncbi:MAG: ABC transporter permease, partial [bacterium]|nr:ABC transporter permease [Candidatus Kapabacteria bacterium]